MSHKILCGWYVIDWNKTFNTNPPANQNSTNTNNQKHNQNHTKQTLWPKNHSKHDQTQLSASRCRVANWSWSSSMAESAMAFRSWIKLILGQNRGVRFFVLSFCSSLALFCLSSLFVSLFFGLLLLLSFLRFSEASGFDLFNRFLLVEELQRQMCSTLIQRTKQPVSEQCRNAGVLYAPQNLRKAFLLIRWTQGSRT